MDLNILLESSAVIVDGELVLIYSQLIAASLGHTIVVPQYGLMYPCYHCQFATPNRLVWPGPVVRYVEAFCRLCFKELLRVGPRSG